MSARREDPWVGYSEELELEAVIRERFKSERYPDIFVDGEDPWDLDLLGEDEC